MAITMARLRAVAAVFETGSFSDAARKLGISAPSVTQLIRDLEREHDVVLFEKAGRALAPTYIAENLYPLATAMLETEIKAANLLDRFSSLAGGEIRIGLGNAWPGMPIIREFRAAFPKVKLEVETGNWASVIALVEERRVDVGVLPEAPRDSRFRRVVCAQQRVVAIAPPTHPLAAQRSLTCGDLREERLIFRKPGSSTQREVERGFAKAGGAPTPAMLSESRDDVFEAVLYGLGIGFAWERASARDERVRKIPVDEISRPVDEHAFIRTDRGNRMTDAFLEIAQSRVFERP